MITGSGTCGFRNKHLKLGLTRILNMSYFCYNVTFTLWENQPHYQGLGTARLHLPLGHYKPPFFMAPSSLHTFQKRCSFSQILIFFIITSSFLFIQLCQNFGTRLFRALLVLPRVILKCACAWALEQLMEVGGTATSPSLRRMWFGDMGPVWFPHSVADFLIA